MSIHPTAVVDPKAELARDVSVGPYAVIGAGVRLGERVRIGPHVVIDGRTTIGADSEVFPFAMLGAAPGHLKDRGEGTELIIGARVSIREHVSLHRGTNVGTGRTVIGDECTILSHAHVGHDCAIGKGVLITNAVLLAGHVELADHVVIGGNSVVHQHCRMGTLSMLGGLSGIGVDVPPYCLASGVRAGLFGLNEVALERRGMPSGTIQALRSAYRTIFRSGMRREEAVRKAREDCPHVAEVQHFVQFIEASKRGLSRHGRGA